MVTVDWHVLFLLDMLNSDILFLDICQYQELLKVAKLQYSMAYVNTEQDNNDLSYFLDSTLKGESGN